MSANCNSCCQLLLRDWTNIRVIQGVFGWIQRFSRAASHDFDQNWILVFFRHAYPKNYDDHEWIVVTQCASYSSELRWVRNLFFLLSDVSWRNLGPHLLTTLSFYYFGLKSVVHLTISKNWTAVCVWVKMPRNKRRFREKARKRKRVTADDVRGFRGGSKLDRNQQRVATSERRKRRKRSQRSSSAFVFLPKTFELPTPTHPHAVRAAKVEDNALLPSKLSKIVQQVSKKHSKLIKIL